MKRNTLTVDRATVGRLAHLNVLALTFRTGVHANVFDFGLVIYPTFDVINDRRK